MRLAVTIDGVGRRRWIRSGVGGALVILALAAVAAVGAGDADARGSGRSSAAAVRWRSRIVWWRAVRRRSLRSWWPTPATPVAVVRRGWRT